MRLVLVSAADAAYAYGIPVGTVWRWVHEGRLRRYGKPRAYLVDLGEVERLAARRVAPSGE